MNVKEDLTSVEEDFEEWWEGEVSEKDKDMSCEEYAKTLAKVAWMNGSYKIIDYILKKADESKGAT